VGLHIDRGDATGCSMYAAVGNAFGDSAVPGGLANYNLCTGERLNYVSFADVMRNGEQFINDVVIRDSRYAYVTDSFGEQIITVDKPYNAGAIAQTFVADICTTPNGIELYGGDYLLVGCADGIYRVNIGNKQVVKVSDVSAAIAYVDGMFFDEDEEILYVVLQNDRIAALASADGWVSLDILYVFTAGCVDSVPATVTLADQTLFAACLGAGPYEVRYLTAVNDAVTNGNDVYSNADDGDDDDDEYDLKKKLRIAVVVLGCACFVLIILLSASSNAMHNMHKARDERITAARKAHSGGGAASMNPMADDESPSPPDL
jgi:hypothetical protein